MWEYAVAYVTITDFNLTETLNEYGVARWELVSAEKVGLQYTLIFKRMKRN